MEYKNKIIIEKKKRTKGIAAIVFLACVGCAAIFLSIYNIIKINLIYAAIYFIAFILSLIYTAIKINTVIPTFAAYDEENIYMRCWSNGFFPFRTDKGVLGEFIPEKMRSVKLPKDQIRAICIGSGNFVSRTVGEGKFTKRFTDYKKRFSGSLKRMEFMHITLADGKERYMNVTDFDTSGLAELVRDIERANKNLQFNTGNRKIRMSIPASSMRFN